MKQLNYKLNLLLIKMSQMSQYKQAVIDVSGEVELIAANGSTLRLGDLIIDYK